MQISPDKTEISDGLLSERLLEELYSKADILYFLLDDQFQIVSCNVTAQEKMGHDKKQLAGKKFLDLVPKIDQADFEKKLQICATKGYLRHFIASLRDHHNKSIDVGVNGLLIVSEDGGQSHLRLFIKDISEQVRNARQRLLSTQILQYLTQKPKEKDAIRYLLREIWESRLSTGLGIFLEDSFGKKFSLGTWGNLGSSSENTFSEQPAWNPRKWTRVRDAVRDIFSVRWTDHGSFWVDSLSDVVLELENFPEKDNLLALSDYESLAIFPLNTKTYSGYLVLTHTAYGRWDREDVEFFESLITSLLLLESETPIDDVAFSAPQPTAFLQQIPFIGVLYIQKGRIRFANPWMHEVLGFSEEEFLDKPVLDIVEPAYHEVAENLTVEIRSEAHHSRCWEIGFRDSEGKSRLTDCVVAPCEKDGSQIWYLNARESVQKDEEDESVKARKLESLGTLTDGIVHDFNNVLSNLMGYSSLLSEEVPKDSPYYEDVQEIAKTSEKASQLTSRLLSFTQDKPHVVKDLNINGLITEVAGVLSRTIEKNITIQAELDDQLKCIEGDAGQIQQAFLQVAFNARDAMPMGGKLRFQTRNMSLSENAAKHQNGAKSGEYVQIIISDTGQGMNAKIREQVFNAQFSTKNQSGRGYGLTLVQDVVQKHQGFISVFSDMTKGTIFKIHFPAAEKTVREISNPVPYSHAHTRETILLIEDQTKFRESAIKMLSHYGYKVIGAENPNEAMAIYKKYINRIDVVILQMISPGVEVQKILAALKKINPAVRIIASANPGEDALIDPRLRKYFAGFVQKPFDQRLLLREIQGVMNA
ncbi:MAG TPA: PAS domain S-box protein [bacterium]|nr:PAS domain S-box protein [bacterium]